MRRRSPPNCRRITRCGLPVTRRQRGGGSTTATACVLAADTVVVADSRILGKPSNRAHAREMLVLLSGTTHLVHTGVVLRLADEELAEVVTTRVRFLELSESEIDWYLQSGEAEGKFIAKLIGGSRA